MKLGLYHITPIASLVLLSAPQVRAQGMDPTIRPELLVQVSEHVHIIPDEKRPLVPNVGFIVGTRGTLVIDTGLGQENGHIVLRAARDLSKSNRLYVGSTHMHPEHDLGMIAFPNDATIIRSGDQETDIQELGMDLANRFAQFSDRTAELLEGAFVRPSDVIFDDGLWLDLGGVHVRFLKAGPAHTRGDVAFLVEEDSVLFTGDVVMNQYPMPLAPNGTIAAWKQTLDKFEALNPKLIIPCHYATGGVELIHNYREYLSIIDSRTRDLHESGMPEADITEMLTKEVSEIFTHWTDPGRIGAAVRLAMRGSQ